MGENTTRPDRTSSPIPVLERWASDPGAAPPDVMRAIRTAPGGPGRGRKAAGAAREKGGDLEIARTLLVFAEHQLSGRSLSGQRRAEISAVRQRLGGCPAEVGEGARAG